MSFLIIDRDRYALQLGETTLGGDTDELLAQSPLSALAPFAVLTSGRDGEATIRGLAGGAPALLNGRPLTQVPDPITHGDRLEIAGRTILYGDLSAAGRTDAVIGITDADDRRRDELSRAPADATAPTGGRLIALADGTRYDAPASGLVIGRDPDCGVIIKSTEVSRHHASIVPGLLGYTLFDGSMNGVLVNGARMTGPTRLRQGDRIRIGDAEFRFEADEAVFEPPRPTRR